MKRRPWTWTSLTFADTFTILIRLLYRGKSRILFFARSDDAISHGNQNGHALCGELSWTHYRSLSRVTDEETRTWYMNECANEGWSSRTLDRNISSQYYYRLLQSQDDKKSAVKSEMKNITAPLQADKLEFIKNPVVAEFLGLVPNGDFQETELENAIISNLQKFLLELGKGYAFIARQQHIRTELGSSLSFV